MTKKDLADVIYNWTRTSWDRTMDGCVRTVDRLTQRIREDLSDRGEVRVHGLGLFRVRVRPARKNYDPMRGEIVTLPPKRFIKFYPDAKMRKAMNRARIGVDNKVNV